MQSSYKMIAVVAVAGAIAAPLILLEKHRRAGSAPSSAARPSGPISSGNPTADRVHELKALEEELLKKPEHSPILFRMAQLAGELGKSADAIGYLRRLLKTEPGNTEARLELGRLLYANNDLEGAVAETKKILDSDPKQVDALYNLGAIYANLNNVETARSYWNRAVASDPASDSGRRAKESLPKLALNAHDDGWKHPPIPASIATHP